MPARLLAAPVPQPKSSTVWVIFEHSAHPLHVEEAVRYAQVVWDFLERVERNE